jgi:hypothetical protein
MGKVQPWVTWALVLFDVALWLFNSLVRRQRKQDQTGAVGWTIPEVLTWVVIAFVTMAIFGLWVENSLLDEAR